MREGLYNVVATDLATHGIDFRALPYEAESFDMVVLDPPYRPGTKRLKGFDLTYRLSDVASEIKTQKDVLALYDAGMLEARRVLRRGGFLVVKCQDAIESKRQVWMHVDLMRLAECFGFGARDLVVVAAGDKLPPSMHANQFHARKTHSYFLVLRKGGAWPFGAKRAT